MKIRTDFVTNSSSTSYTAINIAMLDGSDISLEMRELIDDGVGVSDGSDVFYRDCGEKLSWGNGFQRPEYSPTYPWIKEIPCDGVQLFKQLELPDCIKEWNFGKALLAAKKEDLIALTFSRDYSLFGGEMLESFYDLIGGNELRFAPTYVCRLSDTLGSLAQKTLPVRKVIPTGKAQKGDRFKVDINNDQVVLRDDTGKQICSFNRTKGLAEKLALLPDGFFQQLVATAEGGEKRPTVLIELELPDLRRVENRELTLRCCKITQNPGDIDAITALEEERESICPAEVESLLWYILDWDNAEDAMRELLRIFGSFSTYGGLITSKALELGKVECARMLLAQDSVVDSPHRFDPSAIEAALSLAETGVKLTCKTGNAFNEMALLCARTGHTDLLTKLLNANVTDKAPLDRFWEFKDAAMSLEAVFDKYPDVTLSLADVMRCAGEKARLIALKHVQYAKLRKTQLEKALCTIATCFCVQELERFFAEAKGTEGMDLSSAISAAHDAGKTENVAWLLERQTSTESFVDDLSLDFDDEKASVAISKDERDALVRGAIISLANLGSLSANCREKLSAELGALTNSASPLAGVQSVSVEGSRVYVEFSGLKGLDSLLDAFETLSINIPEVEISGWAEHHDVNVTPGDDGDGTKCDFWSIAGIKGLGYKRTETTPGYGHPRTKSKATASKECSKQARRMFDNLIKTGPVVCKVEGKKIPKTVVLEEGEQLILAINIDGRDTEAEEGSGVFEIKVKSAVNKGLGSLTVDSMTAKAIALNIERVEAFVAKVSPLVVVVDAIPDDKCARVADIAFAFKKRNPFTSSVRYASYKTYLAKHGERKAMFEDAMARFELSSES